jgi:hypothetical protein
MTHYDRVKRKRLADLLVDEGLVNKKVVLAALRVQYETKELLSTILLGADDVDAYDLARLITEQYQVPFLDLENYSADKDLIQEFPAELLHVGRVVPLDRFGSSVAFACQEVPSPEVHAALRDIAGGVFVFSAYSRDIVTCLDANHPWRAPESAASASSDDGDSVAGEGENDSAWQSLFDSANESVMSDIDPE